MGKEKKSVKRVIKIIQEENKGNNDIQFRSLFINCVNFYTDMKLIKYIFSIQFYFFKKSKKIKVIIDEIDFLTNKL